jgi:hypothetical protein
MEKNTKILLGVGAAIALYLILKPKKTIPIDLSSTGQRDPLPQMPKGGGVVQNPEGDLKPIDTGKKTAVEPPTKDCVQVGYNCRENTYNTIQIPLDADCNNYQPAMPQCAPPRGDDMFMVAPEFLQQTL